MTHASIHSRQSRALKEVRLISTCQWIYLARSVGGHEFSGNELDGSGEFLSVPDVALGAIAGKKSANAKRAGSIRSDSF